MDDVTILNTVFDDTIPQTPFNVLQSIGSVDPSLIILDQTDPGGTKEATIVIEDDKETTNAKNTSRVTKIKDDPDKRENLPIKFEQVIIDDLNEEDLVNYNPFCNKEGTKNGRSSPVVYEVKVKKEIVDSDCELDMSNDYADNQQQVKARRDSFQCSICFKKYKNLKSFEKHERQHVTTQKIDKELEIDLSSNLCIEIIDCLSPKNDIFTCTCKKEYILRSPLISCLKSHHFEDNGELNPEVKSLLKLCGKPTADGQLLCKKCKHTCENAMDMISHKLDHKNKQFKCDQCDFVGNKVSALNRHKLSHSEGKSFACRKCSYVCKQLSEFRHHQLTHKGSRSHKCDQCPFTCHLRGTLKKHAREEHGVVKMYHCDQCNYSGTRSSTLQRHTLVHQKEKPFACSECNYRCKLRNKLTTHMLTHRKRNCKCDECGYVAQHFGALKLHKRTHVKKGIFFCDLCPYATPTLEYLEAHKNIHRGKRAYPCLECSYVSTHSSSFRRHLFTHSGEKPFLCSLCDFRACQENTLKIHMRTHSGERPYKCDSCDYASSTAGTLKRHKLVHSPIVW